MPARGATFAAMRVPAFRAFILGQAVSLPGTWMQTVAQGWLVLQLTGSGTTLGLVAASQYVPVLLLAPWAGVLADRLSRRHLLIATQSTMAVSALALGVLTVSGHATVTAVVVTAVVLGLATAVDNPTRQSFVLEMVGPDLLRNAVSLNSALLNSARAVGPALAGLLIAASGPGWCFLVNAISFAGVTMSLVLMRLERTTVRATPGSAGRQLVDGLKHVVGNPLLLWPCLMILVVGIVAWEFPVTLPLLAETTFGGDARTYGWLNSAMGAGAVVGALVVARHGSTGPAAIALAAGGFGASMTALSLAPTVAVAVAVLVAVGFCGSSFLSISNATIQLASGPTYRGRVMSIWSLCFIGSTPIGAPIVGALSEHVSPRAAIGAGAAGCFLVVVVMVVLARQPSERPMP